MTIPGIKTTTTPLTGVDVSPIGPPAGFGPPKTGAPAAQEAGENRPDGAALTKLANMLDMSATDVVDALTGGTPLDELAQQRGTSADELLGAVGNGLVLRTYA